MRKSTQILDSRKVCPVCGEDSRKVCPVCGEDASNYSVMIAVDRPRYVNFYLHDTCYMSGNVLQKIEEFFKERT